MTDDILKGETLRLPVLDKGFVELLDCMPRLTASNADVAIAEAARRSYGEGTKRISSDEDLIRYLIRHGHFGPVEFVSFKFHVKCPLFVARQIFRTRIASYNENSLRYSEAPDEFHVPDKLRLQSKTNKQGSGEDFGRFAQGVFIDWCEIETDRDKKLYQRMLGADVAREQARMVLPVSLYTDFYWQINLSSLLNFLGQRCDDSGLGHPQNETRAYGEAIIQLIRPLVPTVMQAWEDYSPRRGAITLTRLEVEAIHHRLKQLDAPCIPAIASNNKREISEWGDKAKKLGFS